MGMHLKRHVVYAYNVILLAYERKEYKNKKKKGKLHFIPMNYLPIFTFTSNVLSVTLNPQTFKL
jgi:hypothetical protein